MVNVTSINKKLMVEVQEVHYGLLLQRRRKRILRLVVVVEDSIYLERLNLSSKICGDGGQTHHRIYFICMVLYVCFFVLVMTMIMDILYVDHTQETKTVNKKIIFGMNEIEKYYTVYD